MRPPMLLAILIVPVMSLALAGHPHALPGDDVAGQEVLRRVEQNLAPVKDFTATLDVVAKIEGMKIPPMHLTMYFKQPDKVHFDSEGFALLPREGMALPFSRLTERFTVDSLRKETMDGVSLLRLSLRAKNEQARLRRLIMHVQNGRWTAERISAPLRDGSTMMVQFRYLQVEGVWMPETLTSTFVLAQKDSAASSAAQKQPTSPFSESTVPTGRQGIPRGGTITVQYSNYRLNTGLGDEIFVEPSKK